ncbi:uncharacterized protein LOC62_07G009432 [Vanrija pseudolonga]|uniref:BRCT domain-containing protein n=1 Tax=Vanrija pseudolonga TaxID=143232 RepID=A0AAF0YLW0_9TREE|nr:hypothetical protein LOC62_07G009432 [Vanrija pseudolonga]
MEMQYVFYTAVRQPPQVFAAYSPCTFVLGVGCSKILAWLIEEMGGDMESARNALFCLLHVNHDGRVVGGLPPKRLFHPCVRFLDSRFVADCCTAGRWLDPDPYDLVLSERQRVMAPQQVEYNPHPAHQPQPDRNDLRDAGSDTDDDDDASVNSTPPTPARDGPLTTNGTGTTSVSVKRARDDEDAIEGPSSSRVRV